MGVGVQGVGTFRIVLRLWLWTKPLSPQTLNCYKARKAISVTPTREKVGAL